MIFFAHKIAFIAGTLPVAATGLHYLIYFRMTNSRRWILHALACTFLLVQGKKGFECNIFIMWRITCTNYKNDFKEVFIVNCFHCLYCF